MSEEVIPEKKKFKRISCPNCDKDFAQEKKFLEHLSSTHSCTNHQALFDKIYHCGITPVCKCGKCSEPVKWYGWKVGYPVKFVRGHNAVIDSIYNDPDRQAEFAQKRTDGYRSGKYKVWNDGLTKETDIRVAEMSERIGKTLTIGHEAGTYEYWQKGQTKDTHESLKKSSETKKRKFASGEKIAWIKGQTKDTNESVRLLGRNISHTVKTNMNSSAKRFKPDQLINVFEDSSKGKFDLLTDPNLYRNKYNQLDIKCKTCGITAQRTLMQFRGRPICNTCHPKGSIGQLEVLDFVKSLNVGDVVSGDRTILFPQEVDIYVPSMKFGIEYNGLYWHSTAVLKDPRYHVKKSLLAKQVGIRLFSIFEDEWLQKRKIVESMIKQRLNVFDRTIHARKCELVEIDNAQSKSFLVNNHLEGHVQSSKCIGLKFNDELIAVMTLRIPRNASRSNESRFEVARAACKCNIKVHGWLGKLTKEALKIAKTSMKPGLVTYVDNRIGDGRGYKLSGWRYERQTVMRYWWTDMCKRYDRQTFKNNKELGLNENELAAADGFTRINGYENSFFSYI